jgi:hypothetical protein
MTNVQNNNSLLYSYSNKQVSEINEFSEQTGNKILSYRLSYNSLHQLAEIRGFEFATNSNGHLFEKSILTYLADCNPSSIDSYFDLSGERLTLETTYRFSNYDNKTNVDDFYLVKEFVDTYLSLPQVKLQKNNPLKREINGVQNDYEITYTYDFENNLPVRKAGMMKQTRGSGSGQTLQITNQFNYY